MSMMMLVIMHARIIRHDQESNVCFFTRFVERVSDCSVAHRRGISDGGIVKIDPDGHGPFDVICDSKYVVIQRRWDGSENFYRGWDDYKKGFGNLTGEFWLGNDYIHRLTKAGLTVLRVDLEDRDGVWKYAVYSSFVLEDEAHKYRVTVANYSGTAGDSLIQFSGM